MNGVKTVKVQSIEILTLSFVLFGIEWTDCCWCSVSLQLQPIQMEIAIPFFLNFKGIICAQMNPNNASPFWITLCGGIPRG